MQCLSRDKAKREQIPPEGKLQARTTAEIRDGWFYSVKKPSDTIVALETLVTDHVTQPNQESAGVLLTPQMIHRHGEFTTRFRKQG